MDRKSIDWIETTKFIENPINCNHQLNNCSIFVVKSKLFQPFVRIEIEAGLDWNQEIPSTSSNNVLNS